ncbi:hypothetical protein FKM82_005891 [Ascaphus truei]
MCSCEPCCCEPCHGHHDSFDCISRDLRQMEREIMRSFECTDRAQASRGPSVSRRITRSEPLQMDMRFSGTPLEAQAVDTSRSTDKTFLALLHLDGFEPDDVNVNVRNGRVSVSAKHVEKSNDRGKSNYQYKSLCNHFSLPPDVNDANVRYSMENDSTLKIEAPRKKYSSQAKSRYR